MRELFLHAGIVGYVLVACSVTAVAIILERLWTLTHLRGLEDAAYAALQVSPTPAALDTPAFAAAPVAQILRAILPLRGSSEETIGQAADIALSLQRLRLRRYLGTLATIGSTAPFIGLFGTVLGVMLAFSSMSRAGLSSEIMAGGISEALSATALGLLVAVPSIVAYNYFVGRIGVMLLHVQAHVALLAPRLMASAPERETVA